jgi:RimJ/RimL family protein N-acetyltransferase
MRKNVRDDRARLEDLTPPLVGERCRLRPYVAGDVAALVAIANDERVSRWLATHFPFPYDLSDAKVWVANAARERPTNNFAIEVDGALAGGVGLGPMHGEKRGVAEFGYWLGIAWWGRGVATEAARLLADHALKARGFRRLEAFVFAPNAASARVLEKCAFRFEGRTREGLVERDGAVVDGLLYARLASDPEELA